MPIKVTMPRLSDTMESGTVIKWNVQKGDKVEPGDVLADIETDKATMELQAFEEGTIAKIVLQEGDTVPVGETILILADMDEDVEEAAQAAEQGEASESGQQQQQQSDQQSEQKKRQEAEGREQDESTSSSSQTAVAEKQQKEQSTDESGASQRRPSGQPRQPAGSQPNGRAAAPASTQGDEGRIFVSPLARKIAEDEGIDLRSLEGSGPSGRIVRADVEAAIARGGASAPPERREEESAPSQAPAPVLPEGAGLEEQTIELSNMRRTIARRLVESKTTIPHYQVTVSADMDPLLELRKQLNEQLAPQGVKLSVNDFLVRACAISMHQHPFVNSQWVEGEEGEASIRIVGNVNVGVAIALPEERGGGLVVATLRDTDRMGLRQISQETKTLADKARSRGLTIEEMSDSTFTISNLGMFGVDHFNAIINPPNVAILAVGKAEEIPVVRDGELTIGRVMSMTMSSDHRVVDGAMAARYLQTVKQLLENPATLLV